MCNWVTVTLLVGLIVRSIYNWLILLVLWKVERRGAPWISSEKSKFSGRISHIWQMTTTCSSRNPRNVLLKIIIVFGCHVWMYHIHSPKSCGSKFEAIRQQGFIHRRASWWEVQVWRASMVWHSYCIFAMKNLSGVSWLTGQLGYRGANWSLKKGRSKKKWGLVNSYPPGFTNHTIHGHGIFTCIYHKNQPFMDR